MATYAVVEISGKQYKVQPGQQLSVDRLPNKEGEEISFEKVILSVEDGLVKVGTPTVSDIKVVAKVLCHKKGDKIDVIKYKAKSRYRKHIGFRPQLTRLEILSVGESKKEVNSVKLTGTSVKKPTVKPASPRKTITKKK